MPVPVLEVGLDLIVVGSGEGLSVVIEWPSDVGGFAGGREIG